MKLEPLIDVFEEVAAASLLQVQVANFCSGKAGVFIYEATNLTTESSVIEGQEPHIRPRFMFHDQNARLWVGLEYFCQSYDSDFTYGRDFTLVVRLPLRRPIGNIAVNHQWMMTQLHSGMLTKLSCFVNVGCPPGWLAVAQDIRLLAHAMLLHA